MKRMPKRTSVFAANKALWIFLGVVGLLMLIFALGMKRETQTVWTENKDRWVISEYGSFYALHDFYQTQFPATPQKGWRSWDGEDPDLTNQTEHLLFIQNTHQLEQGQFQQLLSWIAQGNHVVMALNGHLIDEEQETEESTQTAKAAQIYQWANIQALNQRDWQKNPAPNHPQCDVLLQDAATARQRLDKNDTFFNEKYRQLQKNLCNQNIHSITLPEGQTIHWLAEDNNFAFSVGEHKGLLWHSKGAHGSDIARWQHGQGTLTLSTSLQPFTVPTHPSTVQTDLNRLDHAFLATYLAQNKSQIWFIQSIASSQSSMPTPLWKKIWEYSPVLTIMILTLLGLFVWRHAHRQGAILPLQNQKQRQLGHYFHAQGMFLWHKRSQQHALSELQQQLWIQWQRRIPHLNSLNKTEQLKLLRATYAVSETDLMLWLQPLPQTFTNKQWIQYLQAHQNLRNAL